MIVRFTRRALGDLSSILDYLDRRSPRGSMRVKLAIKDAIKAIGENPGIGRATGIDGTRGTPVRRYPYLIYWIAEDSEVRILHLRHGARKPWRG